MEESGVLLARHERRDGTAAHQQTGCLRWLALATAALVGVTLAAVLTSCRLDVGDSLRTSTTATDGELIERHFATKTAYWDQRWEDTQRVQLDRWMEEAAEPSRGLRLIQTQLVTRHGIRYPTLSPIKDIEALLAKLAPFETALPHWLRWYALQYNQSVEGELAETGSQEMESLAIRQLAAHGHGTRRVEYSPRTFQLSHTQVQRAKDSAIAFSRRYFENPDEIEFIERPKHNDTLLRFFDLCERYQHDVKRNANALAQMHAFARSHAMATGLRQLQHALHLDATASLNVKDLMSAFSACAFDVALYEIRDQWCSLFTPETVATLDYDDDLKAFYQLAGGYAINYEMASVLLQDIVAVMDQRISGASSIEGAFRFAHAETTLPLMTLLGFGDKTPLYASAAREQIHRRGFRTSALAPFGANIEFRLYAETRDKATPSYYVQVIVNERDDVAVPGCGLVFCPLETLKTSLWRRFLYEYDFAQQCQA